MNRVTRWVIGAYPAGFLVAYVLLSFAATPTPLHGLWRPLLLAIGLTLVLQFVLAAITRSWQTAGIMTSIIVIVSTAAWLVLGIAAVIGIWWLLTSVMRRRAGRPAMQVGSRRISETLAVFAFGLAVFAAVPVATLAVSAGPGEVAIEPDLVAAGSAPDLVVVLLDGYPRGDALLEQFGYDNAPFLDALTQRGFSVADDARSNYTATWATIASMLEMRYLVDIEALNPAPANPAEQYRLLMRTIAGARGLDELRARGYEIVTIPSPFDSAALTSADRYLDAGHLTSFELSLVQHSPVGRLLLTVAPDLFFDAHRARIADAFETAAAVATGPTERPMFLFAHVLSPHAPVVFEADGTAAEPMPCFPGCSPWAFTSMEQYRGMTGQIEHVNDLLLETVDRIAAARPNAVVVLMSDHGSQVPGEDPRNAFRTLFAVRAPGTDALTDPTPVNLLRQFLDAYHGDDHGLLPYRAWRNQFAAPLSMTPEVEQ